MFMIDCLRIWQGRANRRWLAVAALATSLATAGMAAQAPSMRPPFLAKQTIQAETPASLAAPVTTAQTTARGMGQPSGQQAYTLPPDKLAKAIALARIRNILEITDSIWGIVVVWLLLALRGVAAMERWAQRLASRRWAQGLVFFGAFIVITSLANLPLSLIGHHYGLAYGISVQGWASWFGDLGKALALEIAIGAPILLLFNWIVRRWPRRYWLGAWVATVPILVLSIFVEPLFEPIFEKYEPLQKAHPALVAELNKVVDRTGTKIPPDRMYLMKASLKTNGLNAYVAGMGPTKRIVVWDTTAGRIPDDEVLFIFGHESGHYVLRHIPKAILCFSLVLFFVYWACAAWATWMARRFGATWGLWAPENPGEPQAALSSRTGFVVLLFAVSLAGFLLEPASNGFSRHLEHQADVYGQEAIHGIVADPQKTAVAAFNALGEASLDDPNPNPFLEFWLYNHPSTQHRAEFAMHYDPWANGGQGQFFKNQGIGSSQ